MRKSCVIYDSWAVQITSLPQDMAGEFTHKLLKYAFFEEEPTFDNPALGAMFASIKNRLDEDLAKYQAQVERAKSVSKRSRTKSCEVVTMSNEVEGVNVNVNDNENVNVKKHKKKGGIHDFPERDYDFSKLVVKKNV